MFIHDLHTDHEHVIPPQVCIIVLKSGTDCAFTIVFYLERSIELLHHIVCSILDTIESYTLAVSQYSHYVNYKASRNLISNIYIFGRYLV